MKFSKLCIVLLCFTLLSACGKEADDTKVSVNSEPKVDLTEYPDGIQSGNISLDYYEVLDNTMKEYFHINDSLKSGTINDTEEKKELYRKFLLHLNGLNYNVSNDVEQEIDNYFSTFVSNAKHWAEYRIKNFDTDSSLENSVASDYFTDAQNDLLMTMEIMNKYQLFYE